MPNAPESAWKPVDNSTSAWKPVPESPPETNKQNSGGMTLLHNPISDTLAGIGAGVISTGVGAYNLARKIPGVDQVLPAPSPAVQAATQAPPGFFGGAGKFAEQTGEFALPMSKVAKAAELLPAVARVGAEAATAGGVAGVQTGGNPSAMAGTAATTGLLGGLGAMIPAGAKAALTRALASGMRPLSQAARDIAEKYGIPLDFGTSTGSQTAIAAGKVLGRTVAPDLYEPIVEARQAGLNTGASDIAGSYAIDKYEAGQNTINKMLSVAEDRKNTAQAEHANIAAHEADPANVQNVQVGMKPNPTMDPSQPDTVPDMKPIGLPVDIRPTKAALSPLADEISRRMTPAALQANPGYAAIKNILSRPDALPASVAEADLGYLKSILRDSPSAQARRIAHTAVDSLSQQIEDAVSQAGPDALNSLHNARSSWAEKSAIEETLGSLTNGDISGKTGQVDLVNKLTLPNDKSLPQLKQVLAVAPDAADEIGEAYLTNRVFQKASQQGNNFTNPTEAKNLFNQLGPRTRDALFTPQEQENLNGFLELAKRVTENPNPPNTGIINAMVKMGALVSHPIAGGTHFVLGRNLAKILYDPAMEQNIRDMIGKLGSTAPSYVMTGVKAATNAAETISNQPPLKSPADLMK
jgi:hypothetical protein